LLVAIEVSVNVENGAFSDESHSVDCRPASSEEEVINAVKSNGSSSKEEPLFV